MNSSMQLTIVDREPDDYTALAPWMATDEWRVRIITDARSALRCARHDGSSLWMINVDLPDGSGLELFPMISAAVHCPIILVANQYDPEQELAALALRGAMYLCKPLQFDWIDEIRHLSRMNHWRRQTRTCDPRFPRIARRRPSGALRPPAVNPLWRPWTSTV